MQMRNKNSFLFHLCQRGLSFKLTVLSNLQSNLSETVPESYQMSIVFQIRFVNKSKLRVETLMFHFYASMHKMSLLFKMVSFQMCTTTHIFKIISEQREHTFSKIFYHYSHKNYFRIDAEMHISVFQCSRNHQNPLKFRACH